MDDGTVNNVWRCALAQSEMQALLIQHEIFKRVLAQVHMIEEETAGGLCTLANLVLNQDEFWTFLSFIIRHAAEHGLTEHQYFWPAYDRKPREEWLKQNIAEIGKRIEEVTKELEAYDVHD